MPSEQRLHPVSILFAMGGALKALAVPALLVVLSSSRRSRGPEALFGGTEDRWQLWALVLLLPATIIAILKYLSFRLNYEENELVIRTGILFRNERHVPYARIQNLGAVRNVFHRLLGVTEVRVETGSGKEPEATISVLPTAAFDEMRQRVFGRRPPGEEEPDAPRTDAAPPRPAEDVLLALPVRELVLHGVIENRGMLVIAAFFGLLWELGLAESLGDRIFGDASYGRGVVREMLGALAAGQLPLARVLMTIAVIAAALGVVQAASIAWAIVKLYGFRLSRAGEDLRTEYGLFTRVTSTIPIRRVQTLSIHEGPLQRLLSRAAMRVETAGGQPHGGGQAAAEREWIAPIVPRSALRPLARQIMPELDLDAIEWRPVHPNAFRRAVKVALAIAAAASVAAAAASWWLALAAIVTMIPWAVISAWKHVRHLGWAATDDVVLFRSGWIWRRITVARVVKIQAVMLRHTPFDRRTGMGTLRVDTAGASERSHRVDVPYLPWDVALALYRDLSHRAASTVFRW